MCINIINININNDNEYINDIININDINDIN